MTDHPVLIYGGSGGIGSAIARELARAGKKAHLVARNEAALAALAREIGASFTVGDLAEPGAVNRATEEAARGGALGGLVYAVGTINLKPVGRLTRADFRRDFEVNALWAAEVIQAAAQHLQRAENSPGIVLFSSVAVAQGFAAHASVAMAKGAVEGLTRVLAAELAPKIRVNCIAPSLTRTNLAARLTASAAVVEAIAAMHPLQRLGAVQDIAPLAALLLSDQASWITGQVIGVDGGRSTLRAKG